MKKRSILNLIALALIFALAQGAEAQTQTPNASAAGQNLEGIWEGALDIGAVKLRLALKVTKAADGALAAKLDSLDQGANDLPVDAISLKDGAVHFEMKQLAVVFDGALMFQTSETGSPGEYGKIEETFAPVVLKTIGDWILKRTASQQ